MRRSRIWGISREEFQELVDNSNSLTEILNFFGLKNKGNNYKTLQNRASIEGISLDAVYERMNKQQIELLLSNAKNPIPLEKILSNEVPHKRKATLKAKLLRHNLLKNICAECGIIAEWNGKTLALQLDHINGDSEDNRLENLRILCPNCHSQTETFSGKFNKINVKNFCECGTEIKSRKSLLCRKCADLNQRKVVRPSIEQLKEEIAESSFLAVGRKYGVSDNAIRKWIKE